MKKRQVFNRLFDYVAQYKWKLIFIILVSLLGVGFEVAKPLPLKLVIDNVLGNQPIPGFINYFFGTGLTKEQLLFICIGLIVVIVISSVVISLIAFNYTINLCRNLVYNLSIDFFSKLQRLSLSFYSKSQIGDLLQRMSGDIYVIYFLVAQIIIPVFTSLVCLSAMFYIMAKIDLVLALIAFTPVPILGITVAAFSKPINDTTLEQYNTNGQLAGFVQQSLTSIRIIQAFGRESFMKQKVQKHAQAFSNAFMIANRVQMTYNQFALLITGFASALLIAVGAHRSLQGMISLGDLFVFLGYITALYGPVNSLSTAIGTAITIGARGKRVFDIIDSEEVVEEKKDAVEISAMGTVEFRDVTFGYKKQNNGGRPILKNLSFKAEAGEIIAIVGPTGTGKTSLISLLSRFYDPWKGEVLLDGINISNFKLHSLRENIALVLQEPFLFSMSVAENIAFGNPKATREEIIEVAKAAQAHHFIMTLPEGYDTVISETGASLSGGEKQRIAIARAFLKKAPILIMDEPTSAVDAITESKIFQALNHYAKGKTVFLISHRLSTLKHADQIITIKDGVIVEKGTHQSLLAEDNVYADLYKHQHIS